MNARDQKGTASKVPTTKSSGRLRRLTGWK